MSKQHKHNPSHPPKANPPILSDKKPAKFNWSDRFGRFLLKREIIIVIILTLIALAMRLYRLGYLTFWVDEYVHVSRTMEFLKTFKPIHIFGGEKNGILVTISNILGFAIFGKNEFGGRFFIALIGTGLIPATYYFCKKIFNIYIGLMACVFIAFSQYLVFWSRLDRQYGPIPTFYILLILGIVTLLELNRNDPGNHGFLARYNLDKKWLIWTLVFLILAVITNLETYFIVFSSGVYAIYLWLVSGFTTRQWFFRPTLKLAIVSILSIVFFVLTFTPLNKVVMRPIFEQFMPEGMVSLIIPNLAYIKSKLISVDKFKYFKIYWDVINTDLPYTIYFFFAGLVGMAILQFKKFMLIFSYYIIPFLLMGFVFLEPCLPRYHAFIYPLYLVTVVSAFYYIPELIKKISTKWSRYHSWLGFIAFVGFVILLVTSKAIQNSIALITLEKYGTVIDKKLSQWSFTNWRDPSLYVKKRLKPGDLIFATIPAGVDFYLDPDQKSKIYTFRQMRLDADTKSYVPLGNSATIPSASSFEDFYKTLQRNQRTWLITDYYMYNVMTEGRCRDLVFQNFTLIPEASKDGSTQLFLWDPYVVKKFPHNCIWELGKSSGLAATPDLTLTTTPESIQNGATFTFHSIGIDSDREAAIQINNKDTYYIPKPKTFTEGGLGISEIKVPGNKTTLGNNNFKIVSFKIPIDSYKGFVIYNLDVK